jgi:hypothetical protein
MPCNEHGEGIRGLMYLWQWSMLSGAKSTAKGCGLRELQERRRLHIRCEVGEEVEGDGMGQSDQCAAVGHANAAPANYDRVHVLGLSQGAYE